MLIHAFFSSESPIFPETGKPPNKYTIAMGELIRKAREEIGLTQEQLAEKIYRKRLAVYEMESGKVEISAWTLIYLVNVLNKPISYFYPGYILRNIKEESLSPLEQEVIINFRKIWNDDLRKIAINQVKCIADFDPEQTILEALEIAKDGLALDAKMAEILQTRPKYQKIIDSIINILK